MTDSHSVWNTELLADVSMTRLRVQCVRVRGQIIFKRHLILTIDLSITYPAHRGIKASRGEINGGKGIIRQQFQSSQYPLSIIVLLLCVSMKLEISATILFLVLNLCFWTFGPFGPLLLFLCLHACICSDRLKVSRYITPSDSPCSSSNPRSCFPVISWWRFFPFIRFTLLRCKHVNNANEEEKYSIPNGLENY